VRGLRVLIEGLPPGSAYARVVQGTNWSDTDYLLHDVSSGLRLLNVNYAAAHTEKGKPVPKFKALPRPGAEVSVEQAVAEEQNEQERIEMSALAADIFQ
jgi:hypothetical protein